MEKQNQDLKSMEKQNQDLIEILGEKEIKFMGKMVILERLNKLQTFLEKMDDKTWDELKLDQKKYLHLRAIKKGIIEIPNLEDIPQNFEEIKFQLF